MLVRVAARPVAPGHAPRRVVGAGGALGCSGTSGENQRQLVDTVAKYISRYQLWTTTDIRYLLWPTTEISNYFWWRYFHYILSTVNCRGVRKETDREWISEKKLKLVTG